MKILVCVDRLWPCDHAFIEDVLAKKLPALGHQVRIIFAAGKNEKKCEITWHGATAVIAGGGSGVMGEVAKLRALGRAHQQEKWDWVFVRNDSYIAYAVSFWKTPLVFQLSHQKEETRLEMTRGRNDPTAILQKLLSLLSLSFRRKAMRRARLALPISEHLQNVLRSTGERLGDSVVMPLGATEQVKLTERERQAARASLGVPENTVMLLYLGTLNKLRRLEVLIEAVSKIRSTRKNVGLWLVGEGPSPSDKQFLANKVAEHGAANYVFLPGRVSRAEASRIIDAADFGLSYFPDMELFRQNSPTKVMEYLGQGLPTICTPQPEQEYALAVCDGGVLSTGHDADSFAQALITAIDQPWDRGRIREKFLEVRSYDSLARRLSQALTDYRPAAGPK